MLGMPLIIKTPLEDIDGVLQPVLMVTVHYGILIANHQMLNSKGLLKMACD